MTIVTLPLEPAGLAFYAKESARRVFPAPPVPASVTRRPSRSRNRIADLGTLQLINTGTGTVQGLGSATVVVGITEDHSVTPCGTGSSTNASTRRIALSDGLLVLRELSILCPTPSGPVVNGTYEVDGLSSTGLFAGAWGSGDLTVNVTTHTSTLSGKLHLLHAAG